MAAVGLSAYDIKQQGRWKSDAMYMGVVGGGEGG